MSVNVGLAHFARASHVKNGTRISKSSYSQLMELLVIESSAELFLCGERLSLGLCPIGNSSPMRLDLKNALQTIALNASTMARSEKRDDGPGALFRTRLTDEIL